MDILDDIFNTLSLQGALYFRTDFSKPWAVNVPNHEAVARFHLVMQGHCFVSVAGGDFIELQAGDLILIPHGANHIISDQACHIAPTLETVLQDVDYQDDGVLSINKGDDNASTQLVCGHFSFREAAEHPLLSALPNYIVIRASVRAEHPLLDELLTLIGRRVFLDELGAKSSIARLSELVFIELLRSGISNCPSLEAIIDGFRDPKISRSLQLIHQQPENYWTLEKLANQVAMSRSRFAKRFHQLIGKTPMSYLSEWRLQKAYTLLQQSHFSVQQVANQTGYQSAASFSRAFMQKFGLPPSDFKRKTA